LKEILGAKNKSGNTPLHLAAALGREKACHKIAGLMPEMITTTRNNLQETPLFTAVRYGKKNAFFALEAAIHHHEQKEQETNYEDWLSKRDTGHCRRYDGNNILHYAIRGEHLGM
jgi:ankyrin repeat protein